MPNHTSFRLNRSGMLLALISAAFASEAGAVAGRVEFAIGGATVSGANGQQRPLTKGVDLDTGDTVRTTGDGRAQIRFTDGAYVSLQPNTEFAIKDYNFQGKTDGSERGIFGLAKGALRTVTGLVGRVNRNRYQITTPTATVGIRGTGGRIEVLLDGSTLIAGTSGIWTLSNPSGTLDVPAGTFGKAPTNPNQPPQQTLQGPSTAPAQPPAPPVFTAAEQRTNTGDLTALPAAPPIVPLVSGSGYAAAVVYMPSFGGTSAGAQTGLDAVFTGTGQLTDLQTSTPSFGFGFRLEPGGTHAEFGTDGILAWGRWTGPVTQNCDCVNPQIYNSDQGLHYVVGMPTPVMPTMGSATYSLLGATSPTFSSGGSPGTASFGSGGGLTVNFGVGSSTITLTAFNVAMGSAGYALNGSTTMCSSTSVFSMNPSVTASGTGSCGACGCFSSVNGFFAGATAERVGMVYRINTPSSDITGAAALKKN